MQEVARDREDWLHEKASNSFSEIMWCVFIHEQSINRSVERVDPYEQGAGDQGMMFGYATNETENYMPLALDLSQFIMGIGEDP